MKFASNKRIYLFTVTILLLLLLVLPLKNHFTNVEASSNDYQIRMLEVTESGVSELASLKTGISGLTIDTMSMKRFVALRDDLDGKYDAIYIGKGTYNKSGVSGKDHNTKAVMNDITALKAKEITDYFINKGLYVLINKEPFDNQTTNQRGILYNTFNTYQTLTPKSNVLFCNDSELNAFISELKKSNSTYLFKMKQRPQLEITNKSQIIEYGATVPKIYTPGDELTFKFNVSNVNLGTNPILVKLYLGLDKSIKMTEDQVVATTSLSTSTTGEIKYKLPKTYSGLLYWKLEAVDSLNQKSLSDFTTGTIQFKGKKTVVNVLQILPDGNNDSKLINNELVMDPSYLQNVSKDYELVIETKSMTQFNEYIKSKENSTPKYGLNGTYDMLLFGFRDVYNEKALIDELSSNAVLNFINDTKQSVMFTHDTIYIASNNKSSQWINKFQGITGQTSPQTNLGLNAPSISTSVTPVNDGLLTQYPFNLSEQDDKNKVANTHNQYFTLDLEDSTVIPWYNITGSNRDINDSWNHYYTYSKGSVTYSGTGHIIGTSYNRTQATSFPKWEQKLFVNTMYRAFTGANHAPEITVHTPMDKSIKPSYQNQLVVSYTVDDWDLKDKNLFTSIKFKQNDNVITGYTMNEKAILSGETVTQTFNNPLPAGGNLQIEITARDRQGAISTKTINVTVQKIESNLTIQRTQSNSTVEKGNPITFTYTVTPNAVPYLAVDPGEQGIEDLVISNVQFEEKFPPNLEFSDPLPEGMSKSGTLIEGYTLSENLGNINYKLTESNNVKSYTPINNSANTFSLTAIPQEKKTYLLDNSKIYYDEIHAATSSFPGSNAPVSSLGIANDYSIFMLENIDFPNNGFTNNWRIAAGGNINIASFSLGGSLTNADTTATVVAGRNLTLNGGSMKGMAYYGGNITAPAYLINQTQHKDNYIDFTEVGKKLKNRSLYYAAIPETSKSTDLYQTITLKGTDPKLNVFHLNPTNGSINSLSIDTPSTSTTVVNISGENVTISNGTNTLTGVSSKNVLYNFYEATSFSLRGYKLYGTVLAPLANISFTGDIVGSFIGKSISGYNGGHSIDLSPFTGDLPNPTPVTRERVTISFSPISFEAIVKVANIQLQDTVIRVDSELKLLPVITPEDANNKEVSWLSKQPDIVSISDTGVIRGLKAGEATLVVTARDVRSDGSHVFTTAKVKVVSADLTITGAKDAIVGEKVPFEASYEPFDETIIGYEWSIKPGANSANATITKNTDPSIGSKATLLANRSGSVTIVATVKTDRKPNGAIYSKEHTVTITNPVREIQINGDSFVNIGNEIPLNVSVVQPVENSDPVEYVWSLEGNGSNYATYVPTPDNKTIKLKGNVFTKSVKVKVIVKGSSPIIEAFKEIAIGVKLTNLSLPAPFKIGVGQDNSRDLFNNGLVLWPESLIKNDFKDKLLWTSSNTAILTVSGDGKITGLKKGKATITVSYIEDPKIQDSVEVIVENEDRY
ncbi:DUF5057 domain-containing protein [Paenibacillus sp. FSL K6-2859]|uniref:DUF5057 domain-containing protein n=1 Tax=Paenibacillus sp. FSL K6-2859 TaxID=2921482 RepID=UPI0030F88BAB